jgi:hypothetical protein
VIDIDENSRDYVISKGELIADCEYREDFRCMLIDIINVFCDDQECNPDYCDSFKLIDRTKIKDK